MIPSFRCPRPPLFIALALAMVVCILAYIPGLHGPFIFDDLPNLLLNKALRVQSLGWDSLRDAALSAESGPLRRPVAMLTFAINYYFTQYHTFPLKATNLAIHLANGLLLFVLTRKLLRRLQIIQPTSGYRADMLPWLALATVAIWLLHPLNLTSVLYIVQRMASLATLFTLCGLIGFVHGREQILAGRSRGLWTVALSLTGFGLLAVLSKESGVLLLCYVLVVEGVLYRLAAPPELARGYRRLFALLVPAPILLGAVLVLVGHGSVLDGYSQRDFTLTERLMTEARAMWFYLKLIAIPSIHDLGLYHDDIAISRGWLQPPTTLLAVAGLAALLAAAWRFRSRAPVLSFGILWFLAGHSLESTIIPLELVHEHRNYLPQFGPLLILAYYFLLPTPNPRLPLRVRYGLVALYLAVLTSITYVRTEYWKDEWTLFQHDIRNHPDSVRAQTTMGVILFDNRRFDEALVHLQRASDLDPHDVEGIARVIQLLAFSNRPVDDSLIREFERRALHFPYASPAINVISGMLQSAHDNPPLHKRLIDIFERMLARKDVRLPPIWRGNGYRVLAKEYAATGEARKAISAYETLWAMDPNPVFLVNAAYQHLELGELAQAHDKIVTLHAAGLALSAVDIKAITQIESIIAAAAARGRMPRAAPSHPPAPAH